MSPEQKLASIEAGRLVFTELIELPPFHDAVIMERS
jgi:hypothetical protein